MTANILLNPVRNGVRHSAKISLWAVRHLPLRARELSVGRQGSSTGMHRTVYDQIGTTYSSTRRPDPRIGAAIMSALGDVQTVVNVGAGAGAYEPTDVSVIAVDPSWWHDAAR